MIIPLALILLFGWACVDAWQIAVRYRFFLVAVLPIWTIIFFWGIVPLLGPTMTGVIDQSLPQRGHLSVHAFPVIVSSATIIVNAWSFWQGVGRWAWSRFT